MNMRTGTKWFIFSVFVPTVDSMSYQSLIPHQAI